MTFENVAIKKPSAMERIISETDKRKIKRIIDNIGKIERKMDLAEYNIKQIEESLKEPNRSLIAEELRKESGNSPTDDEVVFRFLSENEEGFSHSELFAIENMQYRVDKTDEELVKFYSKYL